MRREDAKTEPLDEQLHDALAAVECLDEGEVRRAVAAVLPVLRQHGVREYERGIEAGDFFTRRAIARHLGLGEVIP